MNENEAPDAALGSARADNQAASQTNETDQSDQADHADQFVAELILGLERAADGESDPEIKSRLRGAAAILSTIGRHVTTEIAAKIIVRAMDL